jgi:hypothetical protein
VGVRELPAALDGFDGPWWIAGGWAVDLYLGRETREHADLDVVALRRDRAAVERALGERAEPVGERQLRVAGEFDVLFDDADGDEWVFRRDPRVRRPLAEIGLVRDGLPILAPEIVLLFKARSPAAKDEADRALLVPRLEPARREWLGEALRVAYPGHAWLEELAA